MRAAILLVLAAAVAACDDPMGASLRGDYFVSATSGSDTYDGSSGAPFKTITKALSLADSGDTIVVYPGRYDAALGEVFPLQIPDWVELIGDEANKGGGATPTLIIGGDTLTLGFVALTISPGAHTTIAGFTVTDSAAPTNAIALYIVSGSVTVRNNRLVNSKHAALFFSGGGSTNHVIRGNIVTGNRYGMAFVGGGGAVTRIESNSITANEVGVEYDAPGGDMGGGDASSAGGNVLSCNTQNDLWTNSEITINAANNLWDHAPPTLGEGGGLDFRNGTPPATLNATGATVATGACT